jgi:hypothetical protein
VAGFGSATATGGESGAGNPNGGGARSYDIGSDGRFMFLKPSTGAPPEPFGLVIVLNWLHDPKRLAVQ